MPHSPFFASGTAKRNTAPPRRAPLRSAPLRSPPLPPRIAPPLASPNQGPPSELSTNQITRRRMVPPTGGQPRFPPQRRSELRGRIRCGRRSGAEVRRERSAGRGEDGRAHGGAGVVVSRSGTRGRDRSFPPQHAARGGVHRVAGIAGADAVLWGSVGVEPGGSAGHRPGKRRVEAAEGHLQNGAAGSLVSAAGPCGARGSVPGTVCAVPHARCPAPAVRYPVLSIRYLAPIAAFPVLCSLYPVPGIQRLVPTVLFPVSRT